MKYSLPENHSLSGDTIREFGFSENSAIQITDVQFSALDAGVGRGESMLVVSPTSTGKTQIALWAIARSIENGCRAVYLVTHRALAKQKFEDFKELLVAKRFSGDGANLVVATGDYVETADGNLPPDPLNAPVLVATYEKYLALLSASGIPADMRNTVVVCDEIQLIGDEHRGQHVEILLTLLKNAGWNQFVGLSAVLDPRDASLLAEWLGVTPVIEHVREKHLRYECWSALGVATVSTERPDVVEENLPIPKGVNPNPLEIVASLLSEKAPPVPVIVFCMSKKQTYDLADAFVQKFVKPKPGQLSLAFDGLPETGANSFLAKALPHRVAIHNADLMDEERHIVERHLLDGKLDVVFSTSTLAAGVNFPLGAAVFASWERWDSDRKEYVPIDSSEFHNMAGRVGRMGFQHKEGRVIFIAGRTADIPRAKQYLNLTGLPVLEPRVTADRFNQLALQLVASGLCDSRTTLVELVNSTFSALREAERNPRRYAEWGNKLSVSVDGILREGYMLETSGGNLKPTPTGKAIAYSGLLPETASFLLNYVGAKAEALAQFLPNSESTGDVSRVNFLLCCACLSAPEFRPSAGCVPTRFLPFPFEKYCLFDADVYKCDLPEPVWQADILPVNGAKLAGDWIEGADWRALERSLPMLSAGMLRETFRNLVWTLQGFASIMFAASDARVPSGSRPPALRSTSAPLDLIRRLPRVTRRLARRVSEGLPDDLLWMTDLNEAGNPFRLSRAEMLALRAAGLSKPEAVVLGAPEQDELRAKVFAKAKPSAHAKSNWLRDSARSWKLEQRRLASERHMKRARRCPNIELVEDYYKHKGAEFENAFEAALKKLDVPYERLDDKSKTGAPDYVLRIADCPPLVVELKSREGDNLVDYNRAVEVLAASEIHGYKDIFCVTLCHPGVDPSVPLAISGCGRLSVVESHDLGEALLRLCEGGISQHQLWQWLATPGQALADDLPFRHIAY